MSFDLVDLIHINGKPNPAGLATIHGVANIEDITTLQKPAAVTDVGATITTVASIATAHVFATGKCMKRLYGTENKGKGGYAPVGEDDSTSQKATAELMYPGSQAEADGMALLYTSWRGLVFIQETDGTVRQIGSLKFPARIKVTYDTGLNEGYKGYKYEIQAYGPSVIYTPGLNFTPAA